MNSLKSRAERLYQALHGHLVTPRLEHDDLELIEQALLATRDEALEECLAVLGCGARDRQLETKIKALKSGGAR